MIYYDTTGLVLHCRTPCFDAKCPACHHLHECNAASRRKWKASFILLTRQRAELESTDPVLVHILLAGIRSYFDAQPFPSIEFEKYSKPYQDLLQSQATIGWGHLVRGRFSSQWPDLQHDYLFRTQPVQKFDPTKWYRKMDTPMLVDCHTLWILHNGEQHGTEKQHKRTK
jgi:hypothetical protein